MHQYGKSFGHHSDQSGSEYMFDGFTLHYQGQRALTAEEHERKRTANLLGVDGGDSMLAPYFVFVVQPGRQTIATFTFEVMAVPFGRHAFTIDNISLLLRNHWPSGGWIIERQ